MPERVYLTLGIACWPRRLSTTKVTTASTIDRKLRHHRFDRRIEAERLEHAAALELGVRDDLLLLELLHRVADHLDRHQEQERRRDDEQRPQRNSLRDTIDHEEQHHQRQRRRDQSGDQLEAEATGRLGERINEQHRLGAFAEHGEEGKRADRETGALRQAPRRP